ncbi:hypothetical protein VTL71DRAFT_9655 [Oculimacula yallundae]|uniref:MJ1316 RNA cyclic group end recognition domain-containing protein n=1 Tax=Oculimacula yallundae TaxID=86028 RepID=A0ABR4BRH4_9HELO
MASQLPPSRYTLTSTETAFAILLPTSLASETNSLRRIHDKSFTKWAAHINILYPSLPVSHLPHAIPLIQSCLSSLSYSRLRVNLDEVGVFKHRKNATVYLKPDEESEGRLRDLRRMLTSVLGCEESEGTVEGVFRPHLGVGQAAMLGSSIGNAVERLSEQVRKVVGLEWECRGLVVLKREASGEMSVLEELRFGDGLDADDEEEENAEAVAEDVGQNPCFVFNAEEKEWSRVSQDVKAERRDHISLSSYNIMAEPTAEPFSIRLPLIIAALASLQTPPVSSLRILTLQEVNDESLPLLLASSYIRETYPYCTHTQSSLLPSARNLVTLASEPFTSSMISFEERHKSALIVSFRFGPDSGSVSKSLVVANVHLTSGLTNEAVKAKKDQMERLTKFLKVGVEAKEAREVLIAGDFNLTTSSRTIKTAVDRGLITPTTAQAVHKVIDLTVWEDAFLTQDSMSETDLLGHDGQEVFEGEQGATFDRATNPIAAQLEPPIDRSPQRYDRVLFRKEGLISRDSFDIFGLADENGRCGSDHYGVRATLNFTSGSSVNSGKVDKAITASFTNKITVVEDGTDVAPLIDLHLPTIQDISQREHAIQLLHTTLAKGKGQRSLIMAPLGSYLMGTYFPDSDVDLLVIGIVNPAAFFDFVGKELRVFNETEGGEESSFKGVHFVNSLVSIVEVCVNGIKFDLQYCQAEELVRAYHGTTPTPSLPELVFNKGLIATLSPSSIRPLNTYRDSAYLLLTIPHLPSYRLAHRYITTYLKNRGLYSAKFGYLGGIHLQLLLNRVVKLISMSTTTNEDRFPVSAATIIRTFFTYYANFNWAAESVTDPLLDPPSKVPRSARDAIFIPAIHIPTARPNVASSCTKLTAQTLSSQFSLAARHLADGDWTWALQSKEVGLSDFLGGSGAFVRCGIDVWGVGNDAGEGEIDESKVREMLGALESRFPRLLVSLGRVPGIEGRVWPARLCVPEAVDEGLGKGKEKAEEGQFKGYYLIGVSAREGMEKESKQVMEGKLVTAVHEFERGVLEAKEFVEGSKNVWLVVDVIKRKEVLGMNLVIDHRDWSVKKKQSPVSGDLEALEDLNLEVEEEVVSSTAGTPSASTTIQASPGTSKSSKAIKPPKATPLRPAHEIIARIKWDPDLDITNYMIGYEDRFIGVKEMALGKWKSESTDEEFIPMHRVVWIRLKDGIGGDSSGAGEGEIVWDRRKKIDRFFGSGVGSG